MYVYQSIDGAGQKKTFMFFIMNKFAQEKDPPQRFNNPDLLTIPFILTGRAAPAALLLYYMPKSSNEMFSLGTPRLSSVFITAPFITGGPQK